MCSKTIRLALALASLLVLGCPRTRVSFQDQYENRLRSVHLKDFVVDADGGNGATARKKFLLGKQVLFAEQSSVSAGDLAAPNDFFKRKLLPIFELYQDQDSPYAGFVSKAIQCPTEYLPKDFSFLNDQTAVRVVELFANDRMIFGGCRASEVAYRSLFVAVLCRDRSTYYELILFSEPTNKSVSAKSLADSLRCL